MIDNSIPMEVKAGEAVVLNQSIVHYSPPNKSDKIRIAITSGVMSAAPKMNFPLLSGSFEKRGGGN
jgi:ectoine hydroxylase-related dioxygenase (phytanoyl-CoA dioxygenase family)